MRLMEGEMNTRPRIVDGIRWVWDAPYSHWFDPNLSMDTNPFTFSAVIYPGAGDTFYVKIRNNSESIYAGTYQTFVKATYAVQGALVLRREIEKTGEWVNK